MAETDPPPVPRFVEIVFDCLPLRSVARLDVPLDASADQRAFVARVRDAIEKHGRHNAYYLHRASCTWRLVNDPKIGLLQFSFEGTVLTDTEDRRARGADLHVELRRETCDWLTEPAVAWFRETVEKAVLVEFNHYIAHGNLQRTLERAAKLQKAVEDGGGFMGMYL
jgi:hypothetical protein